MSQSRDDKEQISNVESTSHAELSRMLRQGRSFSGLERNCGFLNLAGENSRGSDFATISSVSGLDFPDDGRTLAPIDWDGDGDLDLWLTSRTAPRMRLMRNDGTGSNFISFRLRGNGTTTNRDAIGARIELNTAHPEDAPRIKSLRAGESFLTQNSKTVNFGLGQIERVENVIVHWPAGEKEIFKGLHVNKHYELIQGSGKVVEVTRSESAIALSPGLQQPIKATSAVRIPLLTALPLPFIDYLDRDTKKQQLQTGLGQPLLLTLWSSSCPNCQKELSLLKKQEQLLHSKGIKVLALSVDLLSDAETGKQKAENLLTEIGFPLSTGYATVQLIQQLQMLNNLVLPLEETLPVPVSFLIDESGQLNVIYKGLVDIEQLLVDITQRAKNQGERLEQASPFAGVALHNPILEAASMENRARTLFYMGTRHTDQGQHEVALRYYKEVLKLKPASFKTHYNLGLAYSKSRILKPTLKHLRIAVQLDSNSILALDAYADHLFRSKHVEEANEQYRLLLSKNPQHQVALERMAIISAGLKKPLEAEYYFRKAAPGTDSLARLAYNWGIALLGNQETEAAIEKFKAALEFDNQYPDANFYLGLLAEKQKKLDMAAGYYLKELRFNSRSLRTLNQLGTLFEQVGRQQDALKMYVQALQIDPEYTSARANYERLKNNQPSVLKNN